ncbi:MAG: hypothetical protein HKP61_07150 [Dactylosporangium sp.]|nr:hypothetical protein [Dactylosporangium sp.]
MLTRSQLGLERLASWFPLARKLSPIPHLVANSTDDTDRSVESLLLELSTAAEGLYRRLYPDARRLSPEQVTEVARKVQSLDVDQQAKDILCSAIKIYLWGPSLSNRLKQLAEDVDGVIPDVVGNSKKWNNAIQKARNGFAHHLEKGVITNDEAYAYYTLRQSLRWLLTCRILIELGVPHTDLAKAFSRYERYQRFLRNASRDAPDIYMSE